ncbi:hypothetical protein, variant [Aphanomyces astaci]|uniref:SPX domain-containing protein n=1 Tax=Aphanomyces astaci TaxID=112090 RepID=W4GQ36_APHAT|nr:hypothetical protein, variant [Aphanomyces astaci]ETV80988.1 hypothetical protein, variant [Aphanomyces astaci]|eukprot:XP_009829935.1 hypothetical protein, variant [Aphanomyces astaci]
MLTFKDKLAHNIVPEWEEHYVNYSDLKHLVKQIQSRMSFEELDDPLAYCDSSTSERVRLLKTSSTQVHFDQEFLNECEKVDAWYSLQLSACQTKFVRLKDEYADARAAAGPSIEISSSNAMTPTCKDSHSSLPSIVPTEHFNSTCHSIKQSFVALYKSLRMLQNYALLNYTALNKILKKHKRICGHDRFEPEHRVLNFSLHEFAFSHALPVKSCIVELEAFVTAAFFTGDRVLALAELDDGKDTNAVNWQHVVMGVKMGVCMVLALWLLWDDVVVVLLCDTGDKTIAKLQRTKAFPFYRGMAQGLFFLWLWGATLYVWQAARINYRYILELDPHVTPAFSQVFDDASHLSTVYFVSFLLYMQLEHKSLPLYQFVPSGYMPLLLAIYVVVFFAMKEWSQQKRLTGVLRDIVLVPLFHVSYFHTFVTNYMTSSTKLNQDVVWSLCYFTTGEFLDPTSDSCSTKSNTMHVLVPLISALPFWWRFLQCLRRVYDMKNWFPGVLNALKYALSLLVILFGLVHSFYSPLEPSNTLQLIWVVLAVISSLYTWSWDVLMDWGLGRPAFNFLGDGRMYSRTWVYYEKY